MFSYKQFKRNYLALLYLLILLSLPSLASAQVVISEILINPPGTDAPNEYIELRGPPNQLLALGTYLVAIEGDTNGNPGTVQNVFDLSGKQLGGNGFLVLLQKTNSYVVNSNATLLINTDKGPGFGNGSSSSIGHRGENNQTDLENGSATYFLIQAPTPPAIGADIDSDNDGVPDGPIFGSWTILDSIGILDDSGLGDIAYGAINFRRNPAATASGTIVSVSFNPDYVARANNSIGSTSAAWLAGSSLGGTAPNWTLGTTANTVPPAFAGLQLNHIGSPNFGAPLLPGVVAVQSGGSTDLLEGTGSDSYTLGLNTVPSGSVTIQIDASGQLQVSTDNGVSFGSSRALTFTTITPQTVFVRAVADAVIDTSPHIVQILHHIIATADPVQYPTTSLTPIINVNVTERDIALLSELKVNPPGPDDPFEFVEIKGPANFLLTNIYFLAVEGDIGNDPGIAPTVINLNSARIGSSGLLLLVGNGNPYSVPSGTTVITDPHFNRPGGALGNGSVSFLLVSSPAPIPEGIDLDAGNNGVLENLPSGSFIMDSIAWNDGNTNDVLYGGAVLTFTNGTTEAATRFGWNNTPRSADAWFGGELKGANGATLAYSDNNVTPNFPAGATLTPGIFRNSPPAVLGLMPICGVIGDAHNPTLTFRLIDAETRAINLTISSVTSSNQSVVPNNRLTLTPLGNGVYNLALSPTGVGYSWINIDVADDDLTGRSSFLYAASAMGRPNGSFYIGASDASAAIAVDANWALVADDENEVLRLYNRSQSGFPVREFDFTSFLALGDFDHGIPREVDIEASTRVGNRLFWVGSHSHSDLAEPRPNRSRIFATDMTGSGTNVSLSYVGMYEFLKDDLVSWDANNVHGKGANYYGFANSVLPGVDPKSVEGFNIEGVTMLAGSANAALLGFRAPIVPAANRNYALILPVLNFAALAASDAPPGSAIFGAPIELDLYGRGIRSIEGNVNGYMIVAGPAVGAIGKYPLDFRLYTWNGDRNQNAQQRSTDLTGMNPEALVELPSAPWNPASPLQLISDNGRTIYYGDNIEAKHLPEPNFKKSRSDFVTLGDIVKPEPLIVSVSMDQAGVNVVWRSLKGETYRLQYNLILDPNTWLDVPGDVLASGPYSSTSDNQPFSDQCFYRVQILP